jgi:hypothetical protein
VCFALCFFKSQCLYATCVSHSSLSPAPLILPSHQHLSLFPLTSGSHSSLSPAALTLPSCLTSGSHSSLSPTALTLPSHQRLESLNHVQIALAARVSVTQLVRFPARRFRLKLHLDLPVPVVLLQGGKGGVGGEGFKDVQRKFTVNVERERKGSKYRVGVFKKAASWGSKVKPV